MNKSHNTTVILAVCHRKCQKSCCVQIKSNCLTDFFSRDEFYFCKDVQWSKRTHPIYKSTAEYTIWLTVGNIPTNGIKVLNLNTIYCLMIAHLCYSNSLVWNKNFFTSFFCFLILNSWFSLSKLYAINHFRIWAKSMGCGREVNVLKHLKYLEKMSRNL